MIGILVVFSSSVVLSVIAVAFILRLSRKKAWYDKIDHRKIHTGDIPRLGGIGFALVFIVIAAIISFSTGKSDSVRFLPCLLALVIILIFGVRDDFEPMSPKYKLLIQILAALCVIIPGYTFRRISYFETGFLSGLGLLRYPLTVFWIAGLINAMNFIDGVDGLAGGLSAIIALTFACIFYFYSKTPWAVLFCTGLFGAILGFLVFNAPVPGAKIFMGDGGSQFLGITLALLPLLDNENTRAALPLPYAAALLLIPIFDTVSAVWRRIRDKRRIDSPDKAHIHHKLLNLGFSTLGVDLVLYTLQIVLGVLVFVSIKTDRWTSVFILAAAYLIGIAFFTIIHYLNLRVVHSAPHGAAS
ncbi:MAG: undecaprenyl/decaprenyl-phosphate alpha-N-acetylglucosaminyl 1-phosphate transferase [Treponema sp.]|jgi:UDP-GlcNAc:undecaprenyl-phosphate GlcNAc-1-phosphate transferase|nr:undecaprenyl/decaprenyl-phosphate alpha-N-acetylglucosaminyl 1-phosphate transferase [Treponema sp.]